MGGGENIRVKWIFIAYINYGKILDQNQEEFQKGGGKKFNLFGKYTALKLGEKRTINHSYAVRTK